MGDGVKKKPTRTTRRHRELRLKIYALLTVCVLGAAVYIWTTQQTQETSVRAEKDESDASVVSTNEKEKHNMDITPSPAAEKEEKPKEVFGPPTREQMILANADLYPEELIKDLKRNPEILDFVEEYLTAKPEASGGITAAEAPTPVPLFLQWDARWGYVPYGKHNIGISGCGPTCLSMVLYSLTGDKSLTPDFLAQRAMNEGYYVEGVGTSWTFLTNVCKDYGVNVTLTEIITPEKIKEYTAAGGLIICSMGPGDFTDTGHFIVIRGITDTGKLLINDPFSKANTEKEWEYETVAAQMKQSWAYTKMAGTS